MFGSKLLSLLPILGLVSAASIKLEARNENGTDCNGNGAAQVQPGPYGLYNEQCQDVRLSVPINIELPILTNVDDYYSNLSYIGRQVIEVATAPANWTAEHGSSGLKYNLVKTYSIQGYYCTPKQGYKEGSALINLVHGIGFDASYWNYALAPEYSQVKVAASYGYSTFRYDRLGTGLSETPPNGFNEARAQTEVAILQEILRQLKNTSNIGGKQHNKIVGVGHSYGSVQTQAASKNTPQLLDGVILTGFTANSTNLGGYLEAGAYTPAKLVFPNRLGNKPSTWLVTGSEMGNLIDFFYPPYYSEASFQLARSTEQPVTLGSLFTIGQVGGVSNFTGPVHLVNGAKDFIFCTSNCWAGPNGTDIPSGVKTLYPNAKNFSSYIAENTGHGITAHYSQPMVANEIVQWIQSQGL